MKNLLEKKVYDMRSILSAACCLAVVLMSGPAKSECVYDPDARVVWSKEGIYISCTSGAASVGYKVPNNVGDREFLLPLTAGAQPYDVGDFRFRGMSAVRMIVSNDAGDGFAKIRKNRMMEEISNPSTLLISSPNISIEELDDLLNVISSAKSVITVSIESESGSPAVDSIYQDLSWTVSAKQSTIAVQGIRAAFRSGGCL